MLTAVQSLYDQLRERDESCKHCEDVTSDGKLLQVLAAAMGNAQSPIMGEN